MLFCRAFEEAEERLLSVAPKTVVLSVSELETVLESDTDAKIEINFSEFSTKPKENR